MKSVFNRVPTILLTGGTGFIGRNILPILRDHYCITAPSRAELNLSDAACIKSFLSTRKFDYLVHCAILNPAKPQDENKNIYEDTMHIFENLAAFSFRKIIFIGSGAEYDKSHDIKMAREETIDTSHPSDGYGRAKHELTQKARVSENIYNARIFGCYGPHEPDRRFIRHAISCCINNTPITIRQDCRFSYIFAQDLGRAILRLLQSSPRCHDYNLCGGKPHQLSDLAMLIRRQMKSSVPIQILSPEPALEYTGVDNRFLKEFPDFKYTTIESGIATEIAWMKGLSA